MTFDSQEEAFEALGVPRRQGREGDMVTCPECGRRSLATNTVCVNCRADTSAQARIEARMENVQVGLSLRQFRLLGMWAGATGAHNRYIGRTARANVQVGILAGGMLLYTGGVVMRSIEIVLIGTCLLLPLTAWVYSEVFATTKDAEGHELN